MNKTDSKTATFVLGELAWLVGAACWIWVVNWLSAKYLGNPILLWYAKNGFTIGFVQAILSSMWGDINRRENLISAYPSLYIGEYSSFGYAFFGSMVAIRGKPKSSIIDSLPFSNTIATISDFIGIILLSILGLLVLAWMIFIVPIQYFVFLVLGSPARLLMRVQIKAVGKKKKGLSGEFGAFEIEWEPTDYKIKEDEFEFTFHDKPLTLTSIITAIFFLAIKPIL
jgi:hypothetical protein